MIEETKMALSGVEESTRPMIWEAIILGNLLLHLPVANSQTAKSQSEFRQAIEYWTENLCALQKTKTFIFHGIFTSDSTILRDFFDVLLHTTTEYCNSVILLKVHTVRNFHGNRRWILTRNSTISWRKNMKLNQDVRVKRENGARRQAIWELASMVNVLHHKWDISRYWRKNDDYYIDMWNVNVIFLGDCDSFEKLLDSEAPFEWNNREHFIVLAVWDDPLGKLKDRKPLIDRTLRKLWHVHHIQNVFFNEPLSSDEIYKMYSYNPYAVVNENAWGRLETINVTSQRRMLHLLSTLTRQRTINLNGFKFNVSIFDQQQEGKKIQGKINPGSIYSYSGGYNGSSGILLGVIAKKVNFTVNVVEPNTEERYGHQMENGTFSGAVGDVVYHRVIASFASFFVKKYVDDMSGMEFTTTVGFDRVCAIAPKATKIPKGLRIFYIFESSVWLSAVLSYIIVSLTWHYVQVFTPRRSKKFNPVSISFRIFFISTGCPVTLPTSPAERRLLIGVFFTSLTMIGIFNGVLYKSFAQDMFYKDINSLSELDASGLPIGFFSYSTTDLFGPSDDPDLNPLMKRLQSRMIYAPNNIEQAALYRNMSGLLREQYFYLKHQSLVDKSGSHKIHLIPECPAKFYLACLLPSKSTLRERINIVIGRLNQAGLPTLWRTRTVLKNALKMRINIQDGHKSLDRDFVPFQLNDVQICFYILAAGLLLSLIVFVHETGCWKMR